MGNTTSCAPSMASSGGVVKVLSSSDGRVELYSRPIKAAELMLENPRQFVCDSGDLKIGHRIPGLAADEDLERRRLYFLLPMEMLYSVLTNEEMRSLSYKASKVIKNGSSSAGNNNNIIGRRIFPVLLGEFCIFPSEVETDHEDSLNNRESSTGRDRSYSKQRSWKPALDTIVETPCRL